MPFVIVLLLFLSILLFWQAQRQRKSTGLPGGRIIYADTSNWSALEKPLYDAELGITGKPDYLVEKDNQIIPVEVKSSRISDAPYDSHIFQLAAYCLLVHKVLKKRPPYGILHYPNRTFAIDYTPGLEKALLDLIREIREQEHRKGVDRSHDSLMRCNHCGYRSSCDQSIKG